MPLHHKIVHHVRKHKDTVVAHVHKHHKKYIFGAGVVFGLGALKVIVLIGIFLGIHMSVGRTQAYEQQLHVYEQLLVFDVIDDYMHQKYNNITIVPNSKEEEIHNEFMSLDVKYHTAKNIQEKYTAAKNMIEFETQSQKRLQDVGYITPENDSFFNELIYQFYLIK